VSGGIRLNSLATRLAIACVTTIVLTGSAFFLLDRYNAQRYREALTQRLNAPVAQYVVDHRALMRDGEPDLDILHALADQAMVINPALEVYLLDRQGLIVGHALREDSVRRRSVDLAPIHTLIEGKAPLPILGEDPRDPAAKKVFSAAPIRVDGIVQGYLYTVVGGEVYETLSRDLRGAYVERTRMVAAASIMAASALVAVLVTIMLTARLGRLSRAVEQATSPDFRLTPLLRRRHGGDEIDRLENVFVEMSAQIERQILELKENDRLRRELVANISHDLRTPLAAVQGYIEVLLLKDGSLDAARRRRHLATARRQLLRLDALVSDLFELAKLQSVGMVPQCEPFSLSELAQDIVQDYQLQASRKRVHLRFDHAPGSTVVLADIALIHRVFENLLRNAIEHTPAGGEVRLAVAPGAKSAAVRISDTGAGIEASDLDRIFDRFYRAEHAQSKPSVSSGLGLAIVKRILELHDSTISVTSRPGCGTQFVFRLPLAQSPA
jgi:two-component system, OmpR family, sensor kinase